MVEKKENNWTRTIDFLTVDIIMRYIRSSKRYLVVDFIND